MAADEDDRPRRTTGHDIGQDLTLLSVEDLTERIALLEEEVARLKAEMARKRASHEAAQQFFKS